METRAKHTTKRHAFVRGFWRGLAAPLMLYSNTAPPMTAQDYSFKPLPPMKRGDVHSDWQRVGDTLRKATSRAMHDAS